jgi:WD40 repeat protein
MQALYGHSGAVTDGCFWNGGRSICTVSEDKTLRVWNPKTGECVRTVQGYGFHDAAIVCVDVHAERSVAVTGSSDTTARISQLETGKITTVMRHPEYVEAVAFCGARTGLPFLATGCGDGKVRIFDAETGQVRNTFSHEPGYAIVHIEWAAMSPLLYSCSTDGTTAVWDFTRGEEPVALLRGHSESVLDFAVSDLGEYIVSGADDGKALIFQGPVYQLP